MASLSKKRPNKELEEGELGPQKGTKQQKVTKNRRDKRSTSVESQEDPLGAGVRGPPRTWSPQLKVDGVPIP